MGRNKEKTIQVILFRGFEPTREAASFNRNEAVEKMVAMSFAYQVLSPSAVRIDKSKSFVTTIQKQISVFRCLFQIFRLTRDRNFHYIFFLRSIKPSLALLSWIFCKAAGVKMAIERNEFPAVLFNGSSAMKRWSYEKLILPWHYRLFDVVFLMTDQLIEYFTPFTRKGAVVMKLPMTVDFDRFDDLTVTHDKPYVFYAGSLSEKKDGVESLIQAFYEFNIVKPGFNLYIAGNSNRGEGEHRLQKIIDSLSLSEKVRLLGSVSRDDMPGYLCSAWILVLPRPDSLQARGGFPTKLGEYLAGGKPVVVTRVGEIPSHLTEDEVFFISPDHIVPELKEKMIYIADNYSSAMETGRKGKIAAMAKFSLQSNKQFIETAFRKCFKKNVRE